MKKSISKSQRVFIVDDDRDFAESIAEVIEIRGHKVDLAFSGEEAVQKFKKRQYDITFMDVRLPGISGIESFFEIRKIKPNANIVMMTGYNAEKLVDKTIDNGARAILHKPFDMKQVLELIQ